MAALLLTACPAPGEDEAIEIGWIPWDEAIAVTNLWQVLLEEQGYTVTQTQLEVGALYSGVAGGDLDLFLDAWLPATHVDYWEDFGDTVEDLGTWYEQAPLTWTVPAYVDEVDAIPDLADHVDLFDGQVVGIEAGSGLMRISLETVVPTYGLDDFDVVESSTPAMLAELSAAIDAQEPVVVTLWRPHWAYGEWDLKDLEDPENALGDPDSIHVIARPGFSEDHPEVATWLRNFELPDEPLAALQVLINEHDDELDAVREWLEDPGHRALADSWLQA